MDNEKIEKLKAIGYLPNHYSEYLFKTRNKRINNFQIKYTTCFISLATGEVSFEGSEEFKAEMLKELEGIVT